MIIGHKRILDFLKKSVKNKRLAHAYLFTGPSHLGKRAVAMEFIKTLIGQEIGEVNPDLLIIQPEVVEKNGLKRELDIGISEARRIQHQMSLSPYQLPYKIALIDGAERMTPDASNCLLKTLEEPTGKAIIILISPNLKSLLPTIVSRCQLINFLPVSNKEIEKNLSSDQEDFKQIIRLANGRPGLAIQYLENPEILKKQKEILIRLEKILKSNLNERYRYAEEISKDVPFARQILNYWLFWFRDLILLKNDCADLTLYSSSINHQSYSILKIKEIIQAIKKTDQLLSNSGINARLALEVLMLEL